MGALSMHWETVTDTPLQDETIEQLGQRFEANRIAQYCDITFEDYMRHPEHFDGIAKHLEAGGGCRMLQGKLVKIEAGPAGYCEDCGYWASSKSGGLNEYHQCHACEVKYPVTGVAV